MSAASSPAIEGVPQAATYPPRRRHPSAGFLAVCATYLAVIAFLIWGLSTPPLDRVWRLHHELKVGMRGAPSKPDRGRVRDALRRHPALAGALLAEGETGLLSAHRDGWLETTEATVLRTANAGAQRMRIEIGTPLDLLPFAIDVEGEGWDERLKAEAHGVLELALKPARGVPELIVIELRGKKLRADPSMLNVRVTFAEAQP